jgi:hypothetical protein
MKKYLGCVVTIILIVLSQNVAAVGSNYKCTIERVSFASGDTGNSYELYKKLYLGKGFTVDRKSGVMVGELKNSYVTEPQVIDYGSSENSYKVIASMRKEQGAGAGSNIYALTIEEFESGAKKPFVFLQNDKVFFGFCQHY